MSYLLTEIALEMLGYKFYDTDGVFHLTNFQQSMTSSGETHPDEPSLLEFIDKCDPSQTVMPQNGTVSNSNEMGTNSQPQPSSDIVFSKQRRTPARALAKVMSYEREKIINQISVRLERAICEKNADFNEDLLKACLAEEKFKIIEDAEDIQKFRDFLEERLRRIDSRPYEKYLRTFRKE